MEGVVIFLTILAIIWAKMYFSPEPRVILNVYRLPGKFYGLKVLFMYLMITLKKLRPKKVNYEDLEKPQELANSDKPIDASYINSSNSDNEFLITGMARRKGNQIDGFMFINVKGVGLLKSPKLPDTTLWQKDDELGTFAAEGISLRPIVAMKNWEVAFNGEMIDGEGNRRQVQLKADWLSEKKCFNFDTDIDAWFMAEAVAKEKWNRQYFDLLKSMHQTHYEQAGNVCGTVIVDGVSHKLELQGIRDHSFGHKRDWSDLNRYAFHLVTTENGDQINVCVVSMPVCFSSVCFGYVYNSEQSEAISIQECDFQLYQHGESGVPPKDYAFTFKANGKLYTLEVNVIDEMEFYISTEWEAKVMELVCKFKLNGVRGWGVSEWQYRNPQGRSIVSCDKINN